MKLINRLGEKSILTSVMDDAVQTLNKFQKQITDKEAKLSVGVDSMQMAQQMKQ